MFALTVHYLTGRVVAKRFDSHDDPEWPPHPARLFSALVAALHAGGNKAAERGALEWLENQSPPSLWFSNWSERAPHTSYVPVNDPAKPRRLLKRALVTADHLAVLPEYRRRRERTFPSLTPDLPQIWFIWPSAEPDPRTLEAISNVAEHVSYLGHSSSLVAVVTTGEVPAPRIEPSSSTTWGSLRVALPGHLQALDNTFTAYASTLQQTNGSAPRLPLPTIFRPYAEVRKAADQPPQGVFGEMRLFRFPAGCPLHMKAAFPVTEAMRKAAMEKAVAPGEALSGHEPSGSPSKRAHVAYVPLPDVGHAHADGHLLGVAAILPRALQRAERETVLRALAGVRILRLGSAGAFELEEIAASERRSALDYRTWCRAARRWASVTPIVLDRFPRKLNDEETREIIAEACLRVGFPRPTDVLNVPVTPVLGVPPSRDFPPWKNTAGPRRFHTHAILSFDSPVRGPLLLGAGRYRGYGFCRPVDNYAGR